MKTKYSIARKSPAHIKLTPEQLGTLLACVPIDDIDTVFAAYLTKINDFDYIENQTHIEQIKLNIKRLPSER
jgi:hypothetical protein